MLIVGVKKVIVDDVIVVDEEFEIKYKYFNFLFLKLDKYWKMFFIYSV